MKPGAWRKSWGAVCYEARRQFGHALLAAPDEAWCARKLYAEVSNAVKKFDTYGAFVDALCARIDAGIKHDAHRQVYAPLGERVLRAHDLFVAFARDNGVAEHDIPQLRVALRDWYRRNPRPRAALTYLLDYTPVAYSVRGEWLQPPKQLEHTQ